MAPKTKLLLSILLPTLIAVGIVIKLKTYPSSIPTIQTIKSQEYGQLASRPDVFVLDVHIPEQPHLPQTNAFIPYNQLTQNLDKLPQNKNTPILIYCRSGSMSRQAAQTLAKLVHSNL